jgi:sugar fermentation stimulation protein A
MASVIKIEGKILKGKLEKRLTRFSALAKIGDKNVTCFLPNPGRLSELLKPNAKLMLREAKRNKRKTAYDIIGIYYRGRQISVDSQLPNKLISEALKNREIPEFSEYNIIESEYVYDHTRFDFHLNGKQKPCLLEVKSCTLVENGVAMFPDAKTERGRRHVLDLLKAKSEGYRACILFVIQRDDAKIFSPNDKTDPKFGRTLRQAYRGGVEIYAYSSKFINNKVMLGKKIAVKL